MTAEQAGVDEWVRRGAGERWGNRRRGGSRRQQIRAAGVGIHLAAGGDAVEEGRSGS